MANFKFKLDTASSIEAKHAINRTIEIANTYAGELAIEVLPLEKIELDPDNARELVLTLQDAINGIDIDDPDVDRKNQDWKSLESLAKTIQDDQLINPIFVYRYGNKCRLIAGERRTLASAIAGKKEIIARIASQRPLGSKLRILQWVENNERSELTLSERVVSLEALLSEFCLERNEQFEPNRVTAKLLSDLTGISITQARRYMLTLQSHPDIRKAINEGKLDNLKLVELICSENDADKQKALLAAALQDNSFESLIKMKKEMGIEQLTKIGKRRRRKGGVMLGSVKPNIVKVIINALIACNLVDPRVVKRMNDINSSVQWEENESIEKAFKKIKQLLEEGA